jgi:uncharacterized protein
VDPLKEFIIQFVGLSLGNHRFEYEVNDQFFERFEFSQLQHGLVKVVVDMEKQDRMLVFSFDLKGIVEVTCDRCGEEFMLPVSGNQHLIVKFGLAFLEESDEMIVIPSTEYKFDIAPYLYEYLHLMLPWRIVHPDDADGNTTCNPDTLRRLEELAPHSAVDPRWAALEKLQPDDTNTPEANPSKQLRKLK